MIRIMMGLLAVTATVAACGPDNMSRTGSGVPTSAGTSGSPATSSPAIAPGMQPGDDASLRGDGGRGAGGLGRGRP